MIEIPKEMTMMELRDFTVENGLYYSIVHYGKKLVAIYEDRYHYKKMSVVHVPDYKPIKNYKCMKSGSRYRALQIFKKRIKKSNAGYRVSVTKPEEVEAIKNWLEGSE